MLRRASFNGLLPLPGLHPNRHFAVVKNFQLGDLNPHAQHANINW